MPGQTLLDLLRDSPGTVTADGARLDLTTLLDGGRRAATGLRAQGVTAGAGVLLVDDGSAAELLAALLGVWHAGARAIVVPAGEDERLAAITAQTRPALTVGHTAATSYAGLLSHSPGAVAEVRPEDLALEVVSSGTTGQPKCVSYTHDALVRNVTAYARRLRLGRGDVLYTPLPLSVAGVLGMVLLPGLAAGSQVHVGRLSGAGLARAPRQLQDAEPTLLYGVPYVFDLLARQRSARPGNRLRWAICSSAPLPEATFTRVRDALGVPPRSSYCLAEAATVTLNTSDDEDELRATVGAPLDGVEITVEPFGDGPSGRLIIGGDSRGAGYRRDGVLEPFPDGLVRTNDLGRLRDGVLTVTGRVDEVIQVAGTNVDLAHVRRVLAGCPGLGDFAVVIDRHEHLGAVPVLLAEAAGLRVSEREVLAYCRRELSDAETPRAIRIVAEIPRTVTGKVPLAADGRQE
ncbi:hypothetical protein Acy02nite_89080 [Actinoplanes cyaneus]|uniref:Uncharacterized protein n=1 Tax=Actinoplanes cyaneus TaxID=52696 RepID=A0A919IV24_9ACTN|nr:fatty acid--CoA ligase family protein [Actinoplanes cyaneus]MCW2144260.1 Acyl-CoA synthetase (AMP-forming)/AMP-acid ligase II [Actinoplanes cyaneus]GID71027.1 hypothetical protein Acy02nite_89080 [Actinoplanes cyaneus]